MRVPSWLRRATRIFLALMLCCAVSVPGRLAYAGGPLYVGSPTRGMDGALLGWDPAAMPIRYRVDGGPLALRPNGTEAITNAQGITRVANMFQVWQDVPTASISYASDGAIQSFGTFTDGDVSTLTELMEVLDSCDSGAQSPVVFDANGGGHCFNSLLGGTSFEIP